MSENQEGYLPAVVPVADLVPVGEGERLPADQHPLGVYSATMPSKHSRRAVKASAKRALVSLLGLEPAQVGDDILERFPWHKLRYPHVQALKARLIESGASIATVNVTLSHVRGVVREAWRLGYVSAEELARVADVKTMVSICS